MKPLAERVRPERIEDMVGQQKLLKKGGLLSAVIENGNIPNMIFYGPPGTGKTTLARIIAKSTDRRLFKLNATSATTADIRAVLEESESLFCQNGALIYLDEIQYFSKKQQQTMLEFLEDGRVKLIASTTENPHFYIYPALLSRCSVFVFENPSHTEIKKAVLNAAACLEKEDGTKIMFEEDAIDALSMGAGGDVRKALSALELCLLAAKVQKDGSYKITLELIKESGQMSALLHDREDDSHYDALSALHKSMRGSDPDAAVHYLTRFLLAGDMISPMRRILACASEDVGLAYPQAASIVASLCDTARQLGLPEAGLPLTQAVLLLATAPKSNSVSAALGAASADIEAGKYGPVPDHLRDGSYSGAKKLGRGISYEYPHNFENNYVKQQYLPDNITNSIYYKEGNNKNEQTIKAYWDRIKGDKK